ncbi:MAG: SRPBCC family protein [Bauldia sp.]
MTNPAASRTISPAPVRKIFRVEAPLAIAFDVFVRMGRWSNPTHTLLGKALADVVIEPRAGGRWYEKAVDGSECDWGKVLAFDPPRRLLLAWQIDGAWQYNKDLLTEVEVRFRPDGDNATTVEFEHRNLERYGDVAEEVRASLDAEDGWTGDLAKYAALAAAAAGSAR